MVSGLSLVFMVLDLIIAFVLPIVIAIVLRKKYNASVSVFIIGCATFFIFANGLEQVLHGLVLNSPVGATILNSTALYALYGGLAAAVFEEVGRFVSIKFFVKAQRKNPYNAFMFGAGHGGIEAMLILGLAMINNLIYSMAINSGTSEAIIATAPEAQRELLRQNFAALASTSPIDFIWGGIERCSAILLHIGLSLLVWTAVVYGKKLLFPLALFLHFSVDCLMVIISGAVASIPVVELFIFLSAAASFYVSFIFWKKNKPEYVPVKDTIENEVKVKAEEKVEEIAENTVMSLEESGEEQ